MAEGKFDNWIDTHSQKSDAGKFITGAAETILHNAPVAAADVIAPIVYPFAKITWAGGKGLNRLGHRGIVKFALNSREKRQLAWAGQDVDYRIKVFRGHDIDLTVPYSTLFEVDGRPTEAAMNLIHNILKAGEAGPKAYLKWFEGVWESAKTKPAAKIDFGVTVPTHLNIPNAVPIIGSKAVPVPLIGGHPVVLQDLRAGQVPVKAVEKHSRNSAEFEALAKMTFDNIWEGVTRYQERNPGDPAIDKLVDDMTGKSEGRRSRRNVTKAPSQTLAGLSKSIAKDQGLQAYKFPLAAMEILKDDAKKIIKDLTAQIPDKKTPIAEVIPSDPLKLLGIDSQFSGNQLQGLNRILQHHSERKDELIDIEAKLLAGAPRADLLPSKDMDGVLESIHKMNILLDRALQEIFISTIKSSIKTQIRGIEKGIATALKLPNTPALNSQAVDGLLASAHTDQVALIWLVVVCNELKIPKEAKQNFGTLYKIIPPVSLDNAIINVYNPLNIDAAAELGGPLGIIQTDINTKKMNIQTGLGQLDINVAGRDQVGFNANVVAIKRELQSLELLFNSMVRFGNKREFALFKHRAEELKSWSAALDTTHIDPLLTYLSGLEQHVASQPSFNAYQSAILADIDQKQQVLNGGRPGGAPPPMGGPLPPGAPLPPGGGPFVPTGRGGGVPPVPVTPRPIGGTAPGTPGPVPLAAAPGATPSPFAPPGGSSPFTAVPAPLGTPPTPATPTGTPPVPAAGFAPAAGGPPNPFNARSLGGTQPQSPSATTPSQVGTRPTSLPPSTGNTAAFAPGTATLGTPGTGSFAAVPGTSPYAPPSGLPPLSSPSQPQFVTQASTERVANPDGLEQVARRTFGNLEAKFTDVDKENKPLHWDYFNEFTQQLSEEIRSFSRADESELDRDMSKLRDIVRNYQFIQASIDADKDEISKHVALLRAHDPTVKETKTNVISVLKDTQERVQKLGVDLTELNMAYTFQYAKFTPTQRMQHKAYADALIAEIKDLKSEYSILITTVERNG